MNLNEILVAWRYCNDNNMIDEAKKLRRCIKMMVQLLEDDVESRYDETENPVEEDKE